MSVIRKATLLFSLKAENNSILGVREHGMQSKRVKEHGRSHYLFKEEVLMDKCKSKEIEKDNGKSEDPYYRRNRVMPIEGRGLGYINLNKETYMV